MMGHNNDYDHKRFKYACPFCKTKLEDGIYKCSKCGASYDEMFSGKKEKVKQKVNNAIL